MTIAFNKLNSSLRCVPAKQTLSIAKEWADKSGISRVANLTGLDRTGLPVFASIRPESLSEVVTYGKGLLPIEAEVGAYMEAIEFYFAEPTTSGLISDCWDTPEAITGMGDDKNAILKFNPALNTQVQLDEKILLSVVHNVENDKESFIPAELIYHPAPDVGQRIFGSSTNGLASGNTVLESSIHALIELIERDIYTFERIYNKAVPVRTQSLPDNLSQIVNNISELGLNFIIYNVENDYGMPFFYAHLYEENNISAKYFNTGWGCHLDKGIACTRAICEAAQARAAIIHGARSSAKNIDRSKTEPGTNGKNALLNLISNSTNSAKVIDYDCISDLVSTEALEHQWEKVITCLRKVTDQPIFRAIYTSEEMPLQVVRIIVPTLENYKEVTMRVGYRLKTALDGI